MSLIDLTVPYNPAWVDGKVDVRGIIAIYPNTSEEVVIANSNLIKQAEDEGCVFSFASLQTSHKPFVKGVKSTKVTTDDSKANTSKEAKVETPSKEEVEAPKVEAKVEAKVETPSKEEVDKKAIAKAKGKAAKAKRDAKKKAK